MSCLNFDDLLEMYAEELEDENRFKYPSKKYPTKETLTIQEKPKIYNTQAPQEPRKKDNRVCHWHVCQKKAGFCSYRCETMNNFSRHDQKCAITNPPKTPKAVPYQPSKETAYYKEPIAHKEYTSYKDASYKDPSFYKQPAYYKEPAKSWHDNGKQGFNQKPVYEYHQQEAAKPQYYNEHPQSFHQYQQPAPEPAYPPYRPAVAPQPASNTYNYQERKP